MARYNSFTGTKTQQADNALRSIPLVGGGLADLFTGDTAAEQEQARIRALEEQQLQLLRDKMLTAEQLTPEYQMMGDPLLLGESQAGQAQADEQSIAGQRGALEAMQDIYQQGGLTSGDRGRLRQSQAENSRAMRGQNDALMANMQERGMGGSGAALAGMLSNQQGLANANAGAARDVNFAAQNRALQAIQGAGMISGQMRGQSFDESFSRGGAIDRFNQDNMSEQRHVRDSNNRIANAQQDANVAGREAAYGYEVDQYGRESGLRDQDRETQEGYRQDSRSFRQGVVNAGLNAMAPGAGSAAGKASGGSGRARRRPSWSDPQW